MHLLRRKKNYCQNCDYPLSSNYNFCPNCGQENNDKLVSFGTLIGEFFSNYFAYDSRFGRTIIPFLFKPGFLTKEFVAGKRNYYMHPLRLYFIISFVYFLIFSFVITLEDENSDQRFINFGTSSLEPAEVKKLEKVENKLLEKTVRDIEEDSPNVIVQQKMFTKNETTKGVNFLNSLNYINNPGVTSEQVLDSIGVQKSSLNLLLAKQAIKVVNEREETIKSFLVKNASIMMFLLLPFFAIILKLYYLKKSIYYVEHITFTLHIHSFMFFVLSIFLIINYFFPTEGLIAALIIVIYFLFSFKHVYQQKWTTTILKIFLLCISYIFTFSIFLFFTFLISFLTF